MTLNYDCIRDVLLYLEDTLEYTDNPVAMTHKRLTINNVANALSSYSKEDVQYTIEKLYEARYIRIVDVSTDSQRYMINGYIDDITWEGYNFLNNIREKSIWEATKEGAKKVGAMSISAISMISFEIVKAVVTNQEVINKIVAHIPWVK
jgi:hypothetical protein